MNESPVSYCNNDQVPRKHSNDVRGTECPSVSQFKVAVAEYRAIAVHINCLLTHVLEIWLYNQKTTYAALQDGQMLAH